MEEWADLLPNFLHSFPEILSKLLSLTLMALIKHSFLLPKIHLIPKEKHHPLLVNQEILNVVIIVMIEVRANRVIGNL